MSIQVVVDGRIRGLGHRLDGLFTGGGEQHVAVHLH